MPSCALAGRRPSRFATGWGGDYLCRLECQTAGLVTARVLERRPSVGEPDICCRVYAGIPKGERAELIVQKSVELGAAEVCFFPSARCVARPDAKSLQKKLERLGRVALEAAKQCGRGLVPPVTALPSLQAALEAALGSQLPLFFWEEAGGISLRQRLQAAGPFQSAAVVTGPEGGFAPEEAAMAREMGLPWAGMGPRILRCETAPVCALTALMYESENL